MEKLSPKWIQIKIAIVLMTVIPSICLTAQTNPLVLRSTLQYQAPPFDLIMDEHFRPAFEQGLKEHDEEVRQIVESAEKPTFKNTVLALESSGVNLNRAVIIFSNLSGSNTNPELQKLDEEYAPLFAAHSDAIYLNSKLYQRFKAIDLKTLKGEDRKLTEYYLQKFELAGANLSEKDKEKISIVHWPL